MKLQRTDEQLTEQDAIELAKTYYGYLDIRKVEAYDNCFSIFQKRDKLPILIIYSDLQIMDFGSLTLDLLDFTNKALELGYYEIVE